MSWRPTKGNKQVSVWCSFTFSFLFNIAFEFEKSCFVDATSGLIQDLQMRMRNANCRF